MAAPSGTAGAAETTYPASEAQQSFPIGLLLAFGLVAPIALAYSLATTPEVKVLAQVLALLGVVLILARPFIGLILLVGLVYIRPEESIQALQGMRLTLLVSLVTLAGAWTHAFLQKEPMLRTPSITMIVGFGAAAIASTFGKGNTSDMAPDLAKLVVLFLLVLTLVRTPKRYWLFATSLILFTTYIAVYSTVQYYRGESMLYMHAIERSIATGIFSDPNDLAAVIVSGLALALGRMTTSRIIGKGFYGLLSVLMIWGILLTNSRGGMLALLTVMGGFMLVYVRRKVLAVVMACIVVMAFLTFGPSRMTEFDSSESSANSRFWFWNNGLHVLMDHPVLGVGVGQFADFNGNMVAHNSFVQAFAETGMVGYFFLMGCIYYAFRRRPEESEDPDDPVKTREKRELYAARLALLGFLVACYWISRTYKPPMYLLMSLPIAHQAVAFPYVKAPKADELWRDAGKILLLCLASLVLIKISIMLFG